MSAFSPPPLVDFGNFASVRSAGEQYLAESVGERAVVDLTGLESCNSIAVALLMAWFRFAHARGQEVVYAGAPQDLLSIIEISGLMEVLPLSSDAAG
ncbi:MAG: STAS domain-containing protein [Pseudomonadales bacterium]|nr:STAS domain-containing protein [Pseudomonadales bacterium]NIX06901.1 STAS domain-containing protein [Pseudomonadales bacterium]